MHMEDKQRIIQEFVPGKQVTLAHVIANPVADLAKKLGIVGGIQGAIGILTITPSEAAIIAGDVESVQAALEAVIHMLCDTLRFSSAPITRS